MFYHSRRLSTKIDSWRSYHIYSTYKIAWLPARVSGTLNHPRTSDTRVVLLTCPARLEHHLQPDNRRRSVTCTALHDENGVYGLEPIVLNRDENIMCLQAGRTTLQPFLQHRCVWPATVTKNLLLCTEGEAEFNLHLKIHHLLQGNVHRYITKRPHRKTE